MSDGLDSRVRLVNRTIDEQVVYQNGQFVCLMKLFPMCHHEHIVPDEHFSRFHMRFYLPRATLANSEATVNRLVVMANGLDELTHYTLYDEIGSRLASRGVAAVLLPLPDHLNRHMRFRINKPTLEQLTILPSDILMKKPIALYNQFIQYRNELKLLVNHIRGKECAEKDSACGFYRSVFSPETRVSVLGYSLGAAAMLSFFLEGLERTTAGAQRINTCVLLNAAVTLRNTRPIRLFDEKTWLEYVKKLETAFTELHSYDAGTEAASRLFGAVCFDREMLRVQGLLKSHGRRVLFIFGGKDSITGPDKLKDLIPENWGVSLLALPGINHFLAVDEEWKKWINPVSNLVADFEENGPRISITENYAEEQVSRFSNSPKLKPKDRNKVEDVKRRSTYLGIDLDMVYQRKLEKAQCKGIDREELVKALKEYSELRKTTKRDSGRRSGRSEFLDDKKLGHVLYVLDLITARELVQAIAIQRSIRKNGTVKRIGSVLVEDLGVLPKVHLETICESLRRN